MFALLWFQEYSGIRPTTRTIISVRIQDFWLVLWGLFVRVVASRARVFRWFIFLFFFVHMAINHNILAKYGKYDGARAWEPAKGRTIRSNAEMRQMNASESVYKPVYK